MAAALSVTLELFPITVDSQVTSAATTLLNIKQGIWREGAGGFCFGTGKSQQVGTTRSILLHNRKLVETTLMEQKSITVVQ